MSILYISILVTEKTIFDNTMIISIFIDVCIDVELTTKTLASEISWSFGSCISNVTEYKDNKMYSQTCCFSTSRSNWRYELQCKDSGEDGWDGAFITINGRKYCEDFTDWNEKIALVEAKPSKNLC